MGLPRWLAGSIMSFFRRVATNVYAPNTCNPRRSISLGIVAVAAVLFGPAVAHSQSAVRTPAVQITTAGRKYLVAKFRRHHGSAPTAHLPTMELEGWRLVLLYI